MSNELQASDNVTDVTILPPANRDEFGRFIPGNSGNPSGRPKTRLLSEAYREQLADAMDRGDKTYAQGIARVMVEKALHGDVYAASHLSERTEGKAPQAVNVQYSVDPNTMKRIAELSERLLPSG